MVFQRATSRKSRPWAHAMLYRVSPLCTLWISAWAFPTAGPCRPSTGARAGEPPQPASRATSQHNTSVLMREDIGDISKRRKGSLLEPTQHGNETHGLELFTFEF